MSTQRNYHVTNSITFSQALAVGLTHYDWLHKTEDEIAGQEAVHASHSVLPESVEAQRTRDTFGPLFGGSSPSADLVRSSGNRLRALTDLNGSPEYELTWSVWAMPFGEPIIRLRALGRRTDGNGCSGWPTPKTQDATKTLIGAKATINSKGRVVRATGQDFSMALTDVAQIAGWPTPKASMDGDTPATVQKALEGRAEKSLARIAQLAGWPTPMAASKDAGNCDYARSVEVIAGVRDSKNSPKAIGTTPSGSIAATEKRGVLNPALSAWLMGYPEEIISCVDWGTR
jgi:hypothetical protein